MKKPFVILILLAMMAGTARSQFTVIADTNATQLVNDFILTGVAASNVVYTGADSTLGQFDNGNLTNLGINDGIIMTTGILDTSLNPYIGDTVGAFACYYNMTAGDSLLNTLIPPWTTFDASILEFDLNPVGNVLEFQYVFASEEYPEFVGMNFNDVFGFFISGPDTAGGNYADFNIALLPDGQPVAINFVNADTNDAYFVDNEALGGTTIIFDGFTTVLTAKVYVVPSATYHLKMAIADAGDAAFDSGIFLKAQSMKSYWVSGINDQAEHPDAVYPNPVTANSIMELDLDRAGQVVISITDQTGRLIKQSKSSNDQTGHFTFSIGQMMNALPSGIYFIGVQTPDGYSTQKVVK